MKFYTRLFLFAFLLCLLLFLVSCDAGKAQSTTENTTTKPSTTTTAEITLFLSASKTEATVGEEVKLTVTTYPEDASMEGYLYFDIIEGEEAVSFSFFKLTILEVKQVKIQACMGSVRSNIVTINAEDTEGDPYVNVDKDAFYANYTPATSYKDAYYRTKHFLMSGDITPQNENPFINPNRPTENGVFLRNTSAIYKDDGNTYCVLDEHGQIVLEIYRGGAYVTLEEVAAYVMGFGDIPANYNSKKSATPYNSPWGEYLRVNHSRFTGNTSRYPYEPELPNISGCGGDLTYYEMDIGTTGTTCDSRYPAKIYNDGTIITRGAARIVYARYDINENHITEPNERFLFYTNNHYNDFREYLNYYGGWGEIFGNITGGGEISSTTNYNPTSYIETANRDFAQTPIAYIVTMVDMAYLIKQNTNEKWKGMV